MRAAWRWWIGSMLAASVATLGGCPAPQESGGDAGAEGEGEGDGAGGGGSVEGSIIEQLFNGAPTAVLAISPAGNVAAGATLTLDASASSDPDNDILTFEWSQLAGDPAALPASAEATLTAVAPFSLAPNELRFRVLVRDGRGGESSAEATVFVSVGDEFAGHPQALLPYREALTADEAWHLWRRAAFGARPLDVSSAVARGLTPTVDDLLVLRPVGASVTNLAESYGDDMPRRWLVHMIDGPNPLHERMALFWHDRFATSRRVLDGWGELAIGHMDMLRENALGNYREFLRQLTLDPLMLIWLDGANSPKEDPNENYTREFWELFTLGRDVLYTETDIKEGARAFTGITLLYDWPEPPRPIFDLIHHDETTKSIFPGRAAGAVNYDYLSVIDLTLAQPEAAQYVARNLFVALVHDHPSDAVVQELADDFVAGGFEIAPLVRKILRSQAFFSADARGNQISSPVEHLVGVARTLEMHIHTEDSQGWRFWNLANDLANAGQELLDPPGVEGWDEDLGWLQDQWLISRARALGYFFEFGAARTPDLPYHLLPPASSWNQREVRDQIVDALAAALHLELTPDEHAIYVEVLDQNGWKAFHLEEPEWQPQHVQEVIRLMAMDERVLGR